jgi:hypothetical protein
MAFRRRSATLDKQESKYCYLELLVRREYSFRFDSLPMKERAVMAFDIT